MMRALEIVAGSWPIAAMVVALTVTWVVRNLIKRDMDAANAEKMERLNGSRAVVVQHKSRED